MYQATESDLNYPDMSGDVGATMQYFSADVPGTASSVYAGTHDGAAHAKTLESAVDGTGAGATLSLGYSLTPEGAADPALLADNRTYHVPFPLVVGVLPRDGTEASWYTASQVYRSWVLTGAHWTKPGPIVHRTAPAYPDWLLHNDVWINSGRSCLPEKSSGDISPTQGDPANVLAAVSRIAARFNLPSLGHHWYTWECGTKSKDGCQDPNDPDRFKFDTHYPDYLPARRTSLMKEVVQELRTKHNVHTIPYLNGRLFDPASHSYTHPAGTGDGVCVASPANPALGPFTRDQLEYDVETYHSGVHFHVADPSDPRWQDKYRRRRRRGQRSGHGRRLHRPACGGRARP